MKFFYLILILCGLSAQNNNIKEEQLLFSKAMAMEQNNNTDNAINMYKERAIKKKLKKLRRVFFTYIGIIIIFYKNLSSIKHILSNIQL